MFPFVLIMLPALHASAHRPSLQELDTYTFSRFVRDFRKQYTSTAEEARRKAIFEGNLDEIRRHNARDLSWTMNVNRYSDWTDEEFKSARLGGLPAGVGKRLSLNAPVHKVPEGFTLKDLPESVDWREKDIISDVKDQGHCGSCYAHASAAMIESYVALNSTLLPTLSTQHVTECTPNPDECGGTGNCNGNIPELVFDYVKENGIAIEWAYPYESYFGHQSDCRFNATKYANLLATVDGYVKLEENNYTAILHALATVGPLAINVQADVWRHYHSGIYAGCSDLSNIDIDHVVQLVGYGYDEKLQMPYWLVRNSWDVGFGEKGYIRLIRAPEPESVQCGTDLSPLDGTGCKGGPSSVKVCGMCGTLYDASYPVGARFSH